MYSAKDVVRVQHVQDLPEGAVRLSDSEILDHHLTTVYRHYKPELWSLKYGTGISSGVASLGGLLINAHYRRRFKLLSYGRVSTLLPTICLPAMMSGLFHQLLVTNKILVGETACSVCMETRSGAISAVLGCVYPLIISPISCILIARKYYTVSVPKLSEGTMLFKFLGKTKPMVGPLFLLFASQFVLGMVLAEREITAFHNHIMKTTRNIDQEELN